MSRAPDHAARSGCCAVALPFDASTADDEPEYVLTSNDSDRAAVALASATLASLPGASAKRLYRLLAKFGSSTAALAAVQQGTAASAFRDDPVSAAVVRAWVGIDDPRAVAATLAHHGTRVFTAGMPDFPVDPRLEKPAAVLFAEGERAEVLDRPRVAIVGTRAATPAGLADARAIGRYLAEHGITIVSGMAIGIDAAAHEGALEVGGGVVGVVATGLDIVYPRRHEPLYARVRRHGLVLGEHPHGTPPTKDRFPVRNRVIAALCDCLVVVEATASGGTRHTVNDAVRYNREILAVPGSRRNPAASLCNALISEGAHMLRHPSDVLGVLARHAPASGFAATPEARSAGADPTDWEISTRGLGAAARRLHAAMAGDPATLDQLVERSGLALGEVAGLIRELERAGRIERARGLLWPC